jgi:hypothetical protein
MLEGLRDRDARGPAVAMDGTLLARHRLCATLVSMRCQGAACVLVVGLVLRLQPLAAQDTSEPANLGAGARRPAPTAAVQPKAATPNVTKLSAILLVMESAGGVRAAGTLRNALNSRDDLRVVSQSELGRQSVSPAAILTVSAVAAQTVSVAYWDMSGARDWLSAAAPAHADQMDAVVLALASALLDRHRPDLLESGRHKPTSVGANELARTTDALYAVLGRFGKLTPRSNVALRFEDF